MVEKLYSRTKQYIGSKLALTSRTQGFLNGGALRRSLVVVKRGLAQETVQTKAMLDTYRKYLLGQASDAEMQLANEQFRDVLRGLGLSIVVILPFSPITIPAIVKLGEPFGVTVLPSSFSVEHRADSEDSSPVAPKASPTAGDQREEKAVKDD